MTTDTHEQVKTDLCISVSPTQSVLESWAIKIAEGNATYQEAIAALTSKKIIRKK